MTNSNRVVWSEGMFLRPQHFQQQDRFMISLVTASCQGLQPYRWGFQELKIDKDLLKVGKLALTKCRGILPDGTPFVLDNTSVVLDLPENTQGVTVYLSLPISRAATREFCDTQDARHVRYITQNTQINDNTDQSADVVEVQVGSPRFGLYIDSDELDSFQTLAVAKIVQVGSDRNVRLEEDFIAPSLDSNNQPILRGFATELEGMLHQRAESLASRVSGGGRTSNEISDFLLLQAINRVEPDIRHLATLPGLHPEVLYRSMLTIAGELSTFTTKERRPATVSQYKHDALRETFAQLMGELRKSLSTVLEQAATQIDLSVPNQYGILTAVVGNREMLKKALFVLAVKADIPDDKLRQSLPGQIKIGAVEKIAQLINKSLPGVGVSAMPAAPRQIPFNAGTTYFQLDTTSVAWADIQTSGGIALHIAGQYPGLDMTFWAVRQ
ncbi:MAG: type VI secretion system protein ImpJ [Paraglaciecola sp.]|jgi:type VI secretion system protein ImpJ